MDIASQLNKKKLLAVLSGRKDVIFVGLILLIVVMMVIPLPTLLVDLLIALNISFAVITIIVAIYLRDPVDFTTLPAVLLFATVFRLALSVTTTRLILLDAEAGDIISTFGDFVIQGNVAVGLIIFLIITLVQFIVITKGSERVAEVCARFSLDGMPGKQMSIDADLRSGMIDMHAAVKRRSHLQKESELFGSMDGAMKFVKGDAIAGLVITVVNIVGGLSIGMAQHQLEFNQALNIYSILTIGDGLTAQIPALFISIAAGIIITRVVNDEKDDLSTEITKQISIYPQSMVFAGILLFLFALLPGFPTFLFIAIGAGLVSMGTHIIFKEKNKKALKEVTWFDDRDNSLTDEEKYKPFPGITIKISPTLDFLCKDEKFVRQFQVLEESFHSVFGIRLPSHRQFIDSKIENDHYLIAIDDVPLYEGTFHKDKKILKQVPEPYNEKDFTTVNECWGYHQFYLVDPSRYDSSKMGTAFEAMSFFYHNLSNTLIRFAANFMGIQETRSLLDQINLEYSVLVSETLEVLPIAGLADLLKRLLDERVPLKHIRAILEAVVKHGKNEQDTEELVELVRSDLALQISNQFAYSRKISAYKLSYQLEQTIEDTIRATGSSYFLDLPAEQTQSLFNYLNQQVANFPFESDKQQPVFVVSKEIRRYLFKLLRQNQVYAYVLSLEELHPDYQLNIIDTINYEIN
ncbi:type III secretion system export apparatus subunit SctV [Spartinivicinus ruber]|uniref:type III secretion system export apparatus subunit SctV n=1 Tax=Spartinivicinus ruber TaxID=2683272 RepID=UPI0013D4157A|nr:type III secretion system export apparatus subunit SctV [Spartinivicinus ruber]